MTDDPPTEDDLKTELLMILRRYGEHLIDFQIAGAMGEALAEWLMDRNN